MIIASVLAAGALHLAWPHLSLPHSVNLPTAGMRRRAGYRINAKSYHLAGWEMRIQRDGFTSQTRCQLFAPADLRQGQISYAPGVLSFHFPAELDVAGAWYRVDDAPARAWRDDYPALTARRVSLEGASLTNPTGGVVLVPQEVLAGARSVTIRADRNSTPKRFRLKGFEQALASARANGCTDPASFAREPW